MHEFIVRYTPPQACPSGTVLPFGCPTALYSLCNVLNYNIPALLHKNQPESNRDPENILFLLSLFENQGHDWILLTNNRC